MLCKELKSVKSAFDRVYQVEVRGVQLKCQPLLFSEVQQIFNKIYHHPWAVLAGLDELNLTFLLFF